MTIPVKLLLFGRARELANISEMQLDLPTTMTKKRLYEIIFDETLKELACLRESCLLAVNQEYLNEEGTIPIQPNSEIAVIPPLSGG